MLAGCLLHILKPAAFSRWYEAKTNFSVFFAYALFAGFFSIFDVYAAFNELIFR